MNETPTPRTPPRFVPTLTEVVEAHPDDAGEAPAGQPGPSEEQLVRRIMQRVSEGLEQRLREAVAQVVLEQTRGIAPLVAAEVESVVRSLVAEALAQERGR
ncbi:hypothetical protein ACT80S_06415 [Ramlibacter sp. MAHUQ-53]|uniref:hypothetical protein n=1 Tax=unclassified Ramlibacter TaxID=2617605 RepID=UPI003627F502